MLFFTHTTQSVGLRAATTLPGPALLGSEAASFAGQYTPCTANPFTRGWTAANYTEMAQRNAAWLATTHKAVKDVTGIPRSKLFRLLAPLQGTCPGELAWTAGRVPDNDGAKAICNLLDGVAAPSAAGEEPCVIYSLGGNGELDFENEMLQKTSCDIITADCTLNAKGGRAQKRAAYDNLPPRHKFLDVCIGDRDYVDHKTKWAYKTLPSLMASLSHTHVALVKMDIESFEWEVFSGMLARWAIDKHVELPYQMLVELHFAGSPGNKQNKVSAGRVALAIQSLSLLGYVNVHLAPNVVAKSGCCAEVTLLRAFC